MMTKKGVLRSAKGTQKELVITNSGGGTVLAVFRHIAETLPDFFYLLCCWNKNLQIYARAPDITPTRAITR